jgi:hypothetical protein
MSRCASSNRQQASGAGRSIAKVYSRGGVFDFSGPSPLNASALSERLPTGAIAVMGSIEVEFET